MRPLGRGYIRVHTSPWKRVTVALCRGSWPVTRRGLYVGGLRHCIQLSQLSMFALIIKNPAASIVPAWFKRLRSFSFLLRIFVRHRVTVFLTVLMTSFEVISKRSFKSQVIMLFFFFFFQRQITLR